MIKINQNLSLEDFDRVVNHDDQIELSKEAIDRVENSFSFLKSFAKNKIIYGVNTGFGIMAQYRIDEADQIQLQKNLIRSHAAGTGEIMSRRDVRALMLARLNTLALGKSGIHPSVLDNLVSFLNHDITPIIYKHGGVGASGDLVQLAHLALCLLGEGEVIFEDKKQATKEVFSQLDISPINIELREGLGIINGTSCMSGIGITNYFAADRLLDWSICASSIINEVVQAYDDHLGTGINEAKKHHGQRMVAEKMRNHLLGSPLSRKRDKELYSGKNEETVLTRKVQEYYSLRCVPQILGPVYDTLKHTGRILIEEVNSANDNPIIDADAEMVYHGGNFHGDYVALEMDKLKLAVTKMTLLAERQLNYIFNPKLNDMLPPFVNSGELGLNFGMQAAQFTAVSTAAENQTLATSSYIHTIPSNNDNQDIVSMGTNAAHGCQRVINNGYEVVAIEMIALVQALYILDYGDRLSQKTQGLFEEFIKFIPRFEADKPLSGHILEMTQFLKNNEPYGK